MLNSTDLYCPDLVTYTDKSSIDLEGDPYFYKTGLSFNFVIVTCEVFAKYFDESSDEC